MLVHIRIFCNKEMEDLIFVAMSLYTFFFRLSEFFYPLLGRARFRGRC